MADQNLKQQRIHPVTDLEAPQTQTPTAPLFPRNTSKSDHSPAPPPLPRRTFPVSHSKPPRKKRRCLRRCLRCTLFLLLTLVVATAITTGILYLAFRPKLPRYSVNKLQITQFNLTDTDSLSATFNVQITARNPNDEIGIYYEKGSRIEALYEDTKLCEGSLPRFYQARKNTTLLEVSLSGSTQNASGLTTRLQQQQQETGNVPLNLKVKQPVRIKLGKLKLFKVKFRVRCGLLVDTLSAQNDIKIDSSSCEFRGLGL